MYLLWLSVHLLIIIGWLVVSTLSLTVQASNVLPPLDDNGTLITIDVAGVEYYPTQDSSLFYASTVNQSDTDTPVNWMEQVVIYALIDNFKYDLVDEEKPRILTNARYIPSLQAKYPRYDLSRYVLNFKGIKILKGHKFNLYRIEKWFGPYREAQILASLNVQRGIKFGRKVIRLAFIQSYNRGKARNIWLTDGVMWRAAPLKHIGQAHTLEGWAMLWSN